MSTVNSPHHKVVHRLEKNLESDRHHLTSFRFADSLNYINIAGKSMVYFEMTSLLTKITLQITIDLIFEQSNLLSLPVPELERLLIMYTKDVQFQFDDTIRHQNSVEMGSPPSSVLAELLTANFEKTKLKGAINEMICYAGYVDDTFIVCNDQQQTKHLVNVFRDADTNIQFTMEYEKDNEFHFFNNTVQQR